MSELSKAIEARQLHETYTPGVLLFREISKIEDAWSKDDDSLGTVYDLSAKFRIRTIVSNREKEDGALPLIVENAKRAIVHAVFGEFRDYFHRLRVANYDRDYRKVNEILDEFYNQMYE